MEISSTHKIYINNIPYHVYEGISDGIYTKWITKSEWDYVIDVRFINKRARYFDSIGHEILVIEDDDDAYGLY